MRAALKRFATVEQQRHRAVIQQAYVHVGLKHTGFNGQALAFQFSRHTLIESIRLFRTSRLDETRSATLSTVAVQSELAYEKHRSVDVSKSEIHLSIGVFEDSKTGDFSGDQYDVILRVILGNSQQYEEAPLNAPDDSVLHRDRGFGNTLNDGSHDDTFERGDMGT